MSNDPNISDGAASSPSLWLRLVARVEALPAWLQPAAFGPVLLCYAVLLRGGIVIAPIVAILFIMEGAAFLPDFLNGAGLFTLLLLASACGGLAYGLFGRPARAIPGVGRYLAGIIAIAPYVAGVAVVVRLEDGRAILDPWTGEDWFIFTMMTLLFGVVIGHSWFAPDDPIERPPDGTPTS